MFSANFDPVAHSGFESFMAEVASRAKGEYLQRRADIDTTLPYQNVKAAVLIFGEKKKGSDDNAKLTKSQEVRPYMHTHINACMYPSINTYVTNIPTYLYST